MRYTVILFLIVLSMYPLSYAKYNWDRKNKIGAAGMITLTIAAIVIPTIQLFLR